MGSIINQAKVIFLITFFFCLIQSPFLFEKFDELMYLPLFLILGTATSYFIINTSKNREEANYLVNIFLIAFSIRVVFGLLMYGWNFSTIIGDEDASGYVIGWVRAENWYKNGIDGFINDLYDVFITKQNAGQSMIWGIPMFIIGAPSRMVVSVINSFAGASLVIVIFKLAKRLFDFETAKISALLVTFWVSMIVLSSGTSKEMIAISLEWGILYLIIRNRKGLQFSDGLTSLPLLLILYVVRFYAFYMCAAVAFLRAVISKKTSLVRNIFVGIILMISLASILYIGGATNKDFDRIETQTKIIDNWRVSMAETTGSGVQIYSQYDNTAVALPIATIYFFFAPFPWEIMSGSLRASFSVVENIAIWFLFVLGFSSIRTFFRGNFYEVLPILAFCAFYAGFHIWGLSNIGLAWRHKQTVMPLFFLLSSLSLSKHLKPIVKNTMRRQYIRQNNF